MSAHRILSVVVASVCTALLGACAAPGTRVVLLPQADGRPSAVVVRAEGGEQTLDQPYQRATAALGATGAPEVDAVDPAKLRKDNATLFDLVPPAPQRYTLYFDPGGTALVQESQATLEAMLAAALTHPGSDIVVTGHTDTRGGNADNDALSLRRAQELRQILIQRGFPAPRVEAVGRGERDLAVPTADEVDEPRNRRVTIEVR